jgi:uncharacterized tellurite resistance protein B-like protein
MPSEAKKLALLKSLAAIAWADGELCNEELNYLKHLALKFNLSDETWTELEPYLDDPVSLEEGEKLIEDFLSRINTPKEKQQLLDALEEMIQADQRVTPEEQEFLRRFSQIIGDTSPLGVVRGKLKGLFKKTLFGPSADRSKELHDYIHNKLLYKLRRRFADAGLELGLPAEQLNYLTLFGGLLARVAYADGDISRLEREQIKARLGRSADFKPEELELIVAVIEDQVLRGVDYFRLTSEFFKVSDRDQRLGLLDCLFGLAAADQRLLHKEVEEIRSIAYALGLSHKDFITAKLKCLHQNESV